MKLSTKIIDTVEITLDEHNTLYRQYFYTPYEERNIQICGKRLLDWDKDDGRNQMHLEGEDFYRQVYVIKP